MNRPGPARLAPVLALATLLVAIGEPAAQPSSEDSSASSAQPDSATSTSAASAIDETEAHDEKFWQDGAGPFIQAGHSASLSRNLLVALAERVRPAVLSVEGPAESGTWRESMPWSGPTEGTTQEDVGSGFLIDPRGFALTSHHVVQDRQTIWVRLLDGRRLRARVLGSDAELDVALLRVEADQPLPFLPLGDSSQARVGEPVVALGSPFGLAGSISVGILSGVGRDLGTSEYDDYLQTDALVNPGNSGGPLVNLRGEVLGINTAVVATGYKIGFALPVDLVRNFLPDLRRRGRISRGWIGVQVQNLTPELLASLDVEASSGVLVALNLPDGPAERAGIRQGDVMVTFDGHPVTSKRELRRQVASTAPGREVPVTLLRGRKTVRVRVAVAERTAPNLVVRPVSPAGPLGLRVAPAKDLLRPELLRPDRAGLVVIEVAGGGVASRAGLRVGDLLIEGETEPGGRIALQQVEDFDRVIVFFNENGRALLLLSRGPQMRFVVLAR